MLTRQNAHPVHAMLLYIELKIMKGPSVRLEFCQDKGRACESGLQHEDKDFRVMGLGSC